MSNLASDRVLPPLASASAISSSRPAWIAFDMARRSCPRSAKVSSRSAGPPRLRAYSNEAAKSIPPEAHSASFSSVAGLMSVAAGP